MSSNWLSMLSPEELRKVRRKYWTTVIWPEQVGISDFDSTDSFQRDLFRKSISRKLDDFRIPSLISPIHDKDINSDGELSKPHVHVVNFFEQPQRYNIVLQAYRLGMEIDINYMEYVANIRAMMRYLIHLDNPEKYRYDAADVIEVSGAKFVLEDETASEMVVKAILENGYRRLTDVLMHFDCNPSARKWVTSNPTIVKQLCCENGIDYQ